NLVVLCDPFGKKASSGRWHGPDDAFYAECLPRLRSYFSSQDVVCLTHETALSDPRERAEEAQKLLDVYSQASLVITSRIHCALPCVALGTPVIFVDPYSVPFSGAGILGGMKNLLRERIERRWDGVLDY